MAIITSYEVLILAYASQKIKTNTNSGAMTPGTQEQTADELNNERINNIRTKLKDGTYTLPDVRKKWLPKPGKGTTSF